MRYRHTEGAAMIALLCLATLAYACFWIRSLVGLTAVLIRGR